MNGSLFGIWVVDIEEKEIEVNDGVFLFLDSKR